MSGFAAMCRGPTPLTAWEDDAEQINLLDSLLDGDMLDDDFQPAQYDPAYSATAAAALHNDGCYLGGGAQCTSASLQSSCFLHTSSMNNSCSNSMVIQAMSSELCQQLRTPSSASLNSSPIHSPLVPEPVIQQKMEQELHAALGCSPVSSFQQQTAAPTQCQGPAAAGLTGYSGLRHAGHNSCPLPNVGPVPAALTAGAATVSAPLPQPRRTSSQAALLKRQAASVSSAETAADVFSCISSALEDELTRTLNLGSGSCSRVSSPVSCSNDRDLLMLHAMLASALNAPAAAAAAMAAATSSSSGGSSSSHGSSRRQCSRGVLRLRSKVQKRASPAADVLKSNRKPLDHEHPPISRHSSLNSGSCSSSSFAKKPPLSPHREQQCCRMETADNAMKELLMQLLMGQKRCSKASAPAIEDILLAGLLAQ